MQLIDVHPPTTCFPLQAGGGYRKSWGTGSEHLNDEHARIFSRTEALPGWQHVHDTEKLYEMAFHNGAVILEIGMYGGRSATVELRGALAGLAMSSDGRVPQFYGIDVDPMAIARTHETLTQQGLSSFAMMFLGDLARFRKLIPITPSMVFVDGDHRYAGAWSDLKNLSEMLVPGTPLLCHNYVGISDVTRAVDEWVASGYYTAAGQFGCSALLMATDLCGPRGKTRKERPMGMALPHTVFAEMRQALLGEYIDSRGAANFNFSRARVGEATAPARVSLLHSYQVSDTYSARGWPYERTAGATYPDTLPDGKPWPKISIVTPSYNYGRFLEETILSVVNQGYPNVEHIVMDGGSTDGSREVIERYRPRLAAAVIEPDKGQSNAINKGFAKATGEIFTWINADDMLAPGALHAMALAFWHSGADVVAGICEQFREEEGGRLIERHMTCCANGPLPVEELLDLEGSWMAGEFFMQPEVMFTRAMWEKAGGAVREDLFYSMDYEMWLRFALAGAKLHVIGKSICQFRHHGEQKTAVAEKFIPELMRVRDAFAAEHGIVPADQKLRGSARHRLRIASVSDTGYKLGAGIGQKRIMTAFAAAGHDVYGFAATEDGASPEAANVEEIVAAVGAVSPDLVIIGNMHGAKLPAEVMSACARHWATCVVMHDLSPVTGRCAYNGGCEKYLTGCDEGCPTAAEYPALAPAEILPQWEAKQAIYHGVDAPLLLANSEWTAGFARQALSGGGGGASARIFSIRYGVELDVFRPLAREFCRRELDLPRDRFLILASASSMEDERKGIRLLADAVRKLSLPDVTVVCLGRVDDAMQAAIPGVRALGYIQDPARLAMVYSAVDLFVGASREEAFGQVFTEAAACGTASVGFPVGGIPEALIDGVSGYVAATATADDLAAAIYELYSHPERRRAMGAWGRMFAENEWSAEMAYHELHVALRKSGLAARLNFPPKIRFGPHAPTVAAPVNVALHRGEWQPMWGFEKWEGPYPEQGLPRCRWLVGPMSRLRVIGGRAGPHRLRIVCTTFHSQAVLRVVHGGKLIHDVAVPPFVRGEPACEFECIVELSKGAGVIDLIHWPWAIEDSGRPMSILLFELRITDAANEDLAIAAEAEADVPSARR